MSKLVHEPRSEKTACLLGNSYGRLKVIDFAGYFYHASGRSAAWRCQCDCGKSTVVRGSDLRSGLQVSCGCHRNENNRRARTHGHTVNGERSREWQAWVSMIARCTNRKAPGWKTYGGRGIQVCQDWLNSFEQFLQDTGEAPSAKHSIDRINNDGNYEPGNVRWATRAEQLRNRSDNVMLTHDGETLCQSDWAKRLGTTPAVIAARLRLGWSVSEAVTLPPRVGNRWRRKQTI